MEWDNLSREFELCRFSREEDKVDLALEATCRVFTNSIYLQLLQGALVMLLKEVWRAVLPKIKIYLSTNNIARGMVRGSQVRFQSTKNTLLFNFISDFTLPPNTIIPHIARIPIRW